MFQRNPVGKVADPDTDSPNPTREKKNSSLEKPVREYAFDLIKFAFKFVLSIFL